MRVCIEVSDEELEELEKHLQKRALMLHARLDTIRPGEKILARLLDVARRQEKEE